MIGPGANGHERAAAQVDAGVATRLRLVTTIVDGAGGELTLSLDDGDAQLMARAIGLLIVEQLAHGSVVKVTTSTRVFALSRTENEAKGAAIRVRDVYNPQACVNLTIELAETVAALLAASGQLRAQMAPDSPR